MKQFEQQDFEQQRQNLEKHAKSLVEENPDLLEDYSLGDYSGKDFDFSRFVFATLNKTRFCFCPIEEANFYGAEMVNADFSDAFGGGKF